MRFFSFALALSALVLARDRRCEFLEMFFHQILQLEEMAGADDRGDLTPREECGVCRAARLREDPVQPFATDSSAFGFSKNCSSSVEPLSAVVDDWPPWIACVTASK